MSILIRPGLTITTEAWRLVWLYLMTSLHVTLRQVVTWTFMKNLEHVNDPVLKAFTRKSPFDPLKRLRWIFFTYCQLEETFFDLFQIGSKTVICQAFPIPLCLRFESNKKWIKNRMRWSSIIPVWSKTGFVENPSGSKWTF